MFPFRRNRKPTEGAAARVRAEMSLQRTREQTPKYRALGDSLRELRERNHLAEAFENAFQKGGSR